MRISHWSSDVCSSDLQRLDWSVGTEFRAFLRDEEGSPTASLGCSRGIADDWLVLAADLAAHQLDKVAADRQSERSEEHTSELQSLMRISYAVFCLKKKK